MDNVREPKPTRSFKEIFEAAYSAKDKMSEEDRKVMLAYCDEIEMHLKALLTFPSLTLLQPVQLGVHKCRLDIEKIRTILKGEENGPVQTNCKEC